MERRLYALIGELDEWLDSTSPLAEASGKDARAERLMTIQTYALLMIAITLADEIAPRLETEPSI